MNSLPAPKRGASGPPDFFSPQVSAARRFYLDLTPPPDRPLDVVCGGVEHCAEDYVIRRESFPFHCLEYVARGSGMLTLGGRTHPLKPGRLFSYGPGVEHEIASDSADPLVKYFVNFAGTEAPALLRRCGLAPGTASQVFPPNAAQGLFDELIACGLHGSRHTPELCVRLLECLALKILENNAPMGRSGTLAFATYQSCRRHIQEHFLRLKTLQQIAGECHVDAAYLCRLFRRYDHQSPYHYLLRLKMNQAAEWLQQPGALVKQAAERAGFSDAFHFSRAFKSVFGLAPDQFRKLR